MPCLCRSGGIAIAALALGLSACGGSGETVGEALGYEQKGPDEMTVIKRPALTVPPDYNLRPPRPDEPAAEADAASKAARETLIGPSSGLSPEGAAKSGITAVNAAPSSDLASASDRAKATLTGAEQEGQAYEKSPPLSSGDEQTADATAENSPSAGQSALLSRTNRVERDLDALGRTRDENRVDGALLRRLLAWAPAPTTSKGSDASDGGEPSAGPVVEIVQREQTPVQTGIRSE